MNTNLYILFPILLSDIVNPVLFAGVVLALGTARPFRYSLSLLCSDVVTYFVAGLFIALGLEAILNFLKNPRPIDFYIELVIGLVLLYVGMRAVFPGNSYREKP